MRKDKFTSLADKGFVMGVCKVFLLLSVVLYLAFNFAFNNPFCSAPRHLSSSPRKNSDDSPTNLNHLLFGILGSEEAWPRRRAYTESWWRPNVTRGYLILDTPPKGELLPWPSSSPPYTVSDDITQLIQEIHHAAPIQARMVHGIMEVFRMRHEGVRWVVMGDDDSLFLVDNMVEILARYDHTKYYYFGGQSEFIYTNYWLSFEQGFGGAGIILSYPLAEALANDIDGCLSRYRHLKSADHITMSCIADIGVNLSPLKGTHQIDLRGDISGFLSYHPKVPLLSLHHFESIDPIFPAMNQSQSVKHFMKAAELDQSRMLQQTICYDRQLTNWSVHVSWGYSVHIYELILSRSYLQKPIETFRTWAPLDRPPFYMFNTRLPTPNDSCHTPHVFSYKSVSKTQKDGILTTYLRSSNRGLPPCVYDGNHSADPISVIQVYSPFTKRTEIGRCECCDIIHTASPDILTVKYRECAADEIIT